MKTKLTNDQMIVKLIDFHTDRLTRIGMEYKISMFIESYKNISRSKLIKEYEAQFNTEVSESMVEIESTLNASNGTIVRNNVTYSAALMG